MSDETARRVARRWVRRTAKRYRAPGEVHDTLPEEARFVRRMGPHDGYRDGDWVYLVDRATGAVVKSEMVRLAAADHWTVYLFSDTGRTLYEETFPARDTRDAERKALAVIRPQLAKFDHAEDWVVEPATR